MPNMVQSDFTLDLESMRDEEIQMKKTLNGILHGNKWIIFHDPPHIELPLSKRVGCNTKPEIVTINQIDVDSYKNYIAMAGTQTRTTVGSPQHDPPSLHTKLEDP